MKKIVFLFVMLLVLAGIVFAQSDGINVLNQIRVYYLDFNRKQVEYAIDSYDQNKFQQERSFKKLYTDYFNYYNKVLRFPDNLPDFEIDEKYTKENENEYKKLGIGINANGDFRYFAPDYEMLINTPEIPKCWAQWLQLQQKYTLENRKYCERISKEGHSCYGNTMMPSELEQAIVELEKVENLSNELSSIRAVDYNYIPYTSFDLLRKYFYGTEMELDLNTPDDGVPVKVHNNVLKSYRHFIKNHKDSKYWPVVNQYYNELKRDKFIITDDTAIWLFGELQKIKSF